MNTLVYGNWDDIMFENVHLPSPSSYAGIASFLQTLQEKGIHSVHLWQLLIRSATFGQQFHIEIDNLVVEPSQWVPL